MRISDWSSDVCSSDLAVRPLGVRVPLDLAGAIPGESRLSVAQHRVIRERALQLVRGPHELVSELVPAVEAEDVRRDRRDDDVGLPFTLHLRQYRRRNVDVLHVSAVQLPQPVVRLADVPGEMATDERLGADIDIDVRYVDIVSVSVHTPRILVT